jgi:hypothetical protein
LRIAGRTIEPESSSRSSENRSSNHAVVAAENLDRANRNGGNRVDRRLSSRSSDRELDHHTFLSRIETSDANRKQGRGLAGPRDRRRDWICNCIRYGKQSLEANFSRHAHSACARWSQHARHQNRNRPVASICQNRSALERSAIPFQISRLPIRSYRLIYCVLCCFVSRPKKNGRTIVTDSYPDCDLALDRRCPLLVRRHLCCDSGRDLCVIRCSLAFDPQSGIADPQLSWRRGWDSNPRGLAPCRFSRPEPSTTRPPLPGFRSRSVPLTTRWASRGVAPRIISSTLEPPLLAARLNSTAGYSGRRPRLQKCLDSELCSVEHKQ